MGGTRDALQQAYAGEAKAALRLKVYAQKAEEEGYPQMAKLFRVIAWSEEIHGARALRVLKEIKTTEENLAESFQSEQGVAEVAYSQFVKEAEAEGNQAAVLHFSQSRDVEETHAKLYKEAMNHLHGGEGDDLPRLPGLRLRRGRPSAGESVRSAAPGKRNSRPSVDGDRSGARSDRS